MNIKEIIVCKCFKKDIKELQKKCRNSALEKEIINHLLDVIRNGDYKHSIPKIYESKIGVLFKSRFKGCSGKGKRGGFRIIWGLKQEKFILVKMYSKSQVESIPIEELVNELINCLKNSDFEKYPKK
ncbi:MAG: hypothetical protein GXO22_08785 [Aquificae bacterium]|nr:hypothetical protein [Aquificota bacterium]